MAQVRSAAQTDIVRVKAIADQNKAALGFVSRGELTKAIAKNSLIVAVKDDEVIGYCLFYRCTSRKPGQFTVNSIVVAEQWRGRGIGRLLIAQLVTLGPRIIMLKCIAGTPANQFYAALGFVSLGEEHKAGRQPLNLWMLNVGD